MNLALRTRYWSDEQARRAFVVFIRGIHNVDFTAWSEAGYWDDDYIPFSYFEGERVVANVCIYTMPAVVNGESCRIAQVSGVGTLPSHRLRGLNRQLHAVALQWALPRHRFVFLFADDDARPFYAKVGFVPTDDFVASVDLAGTPPRSGLEKLDLRVPAVREFIYRAACNRAPISGVLANLNPKLVMYHALYRHSEHAYRIADLDAVVFASTGGATTVVYDVLARVLPGFDALYPYLSTGRAERFEFHFSPDRLGIPAPTLTPLAGSNAHVMGQTGIDRLVFPATARA